MTSLFIGVVSHEGSQFAINQGSEGLAAQLGSFLDQGGISVELQINTDNLYDFENGSVTREMTQASLVAQLALERTWARFLGRPRSPAWWFTYGLRWLVLGGRLLRSANPRLTRRLLNIELSHVDLLRKGVDSAKDWILILEDDAVSIDINDCAMGIASLMKADASQPQYINISESFSDFQLGVSHLLSPVSSTSWEGRSPRRLLSARRPLTNTVCAILYRASFVPGLLAAIDSLPREPVVPIDWKMNQALMTMYSTGSVKPGDCWLVEPAPIVQMSMHSVG